MENELKTWVLGLVASLFSGISIFQFLFYKSEKRKHEAEAEGQVIENQKKRQDIRTDSYEALQTQCDTMMTQLMGMQTELAKAFMDVAVLSGKLAAANEENKRLSDDLERVTQDRDYYRSRCEELSGELVQESSYGKF